MKTTAAAVSAALFSFLLGHAGVWLHSEMFVRFFYEARMVALTHVFTLGWVSLMIVGVLRQLGPVAFGLNLRYADWIGVSLTLWIPGLITMVIGFATLRYRMAAAGTLLVFAAVLLFAFVFLVSFRGVPKDIPHYHLLAGLTYLIAAAILGTWMALGKGFDVQLPASFHRVLFAHIHLAGAGWAGMMIFAVMSRLFPQPHLRHPLAAKTRFLGFNFGLAGLTAGLLAGADWYPLFGIILAVSAAAYVAAFVPVLLEFRQRGDRSTAFLVAAWVSLAITALVGVWLCLPSTKPAVFVVQLQFVYGFVYMFGWLSLMMIGMLYRILPTHISKFLASRALSAPPSMRRTFADPDLQTTVVAWLTAGLAAASAGILYENPAVFRFGWYVWMIGLAGFLFSLLRLGKELRSVRGLDRRVF